jgi:glycosyltransferase involved in cell wall biosynthesis
VKNKISVVIPTYNGRTKLPKILNALEQQTLNNFEVVVVIDGSTDDSFQYLTSYSSEQFKLNVVEQRNLGRAGVRNSGASHATGNLLIFLDDDMRPEYNVLEMHAQFHEKYEKAICGGNQLENRLDAQNDFDLYRCHIRETWVQRYKGITELSEKNAYLTAANFSIVKADFIKLGGFKEDLQDHEDRELALRALRKGYRLFFDPTNVAWHDDFISVIAYIQRRRQYQQAFSLLNNQTRNSKVKKWILYHWLSNTLFVSGIKNSSFTFLPKVIRYRLYSLVIWGMSHYFTDRKLPE